MFVRDLKADEEEPGANQDFLKEYSGVSHFSWGDTNRATYCLALACCFYLNVKWVMNRFFKKELERIPQGDFELEYNPDQLEEAYRHCEDLFAQEFTTFMDKLGAKEIKE